MHKQQHLFSTDFLETENVSIQYVCLGWVGGVGGHVGRVGVGWGGVGCVVHG